MAKSTEQLLFRGRIGMLSAYFVPRTSDTPPTATLTGPTGDHDLAVTACDDHPDFGARWQITPPEPWWAEGVYTLTVSSGEVYELYVGGRRPKLARSETARLADVDPAQIAELVATFGPSAVPAVGPVAQEFYDRKRALMRGEG